MAEQKLSALRVIEESFRVFMARPGHFVAIGLLCGAPGLVLGRLDAPAFLLVLVGLFSSAVLAPLVIYSVMMALRGAPDPISASLHHGLQRLREALGASIAVVIASLLFIMPAAALAASLAIFFGTQAGAPLGAAFIVTMMIWVLARYFLAVPAAVVERRSPVASLARSLDLANGHYGAILGALAAQAGLLGLPTLLLATAQTEAEPAAAPSEVSLLLAELYGAGVAAPLALITTAVVFFRLREEEQGIAP